MRLYVVLCSPVAFAQSRIDQHSVNRIRNYFKPDVAPC